MRLLHRAIAAVLVTVVLAAPVSSPAKSTTARGYVGTVRGTHAFVGVAVSGSQVTAYVCDSKRIAQWFKGSLHAATVTLTSKAGYVLHLAVGNQQVTGTLRLPGKAGTIHRLVTAGATRPAGLYRGVKTVAGKRYLGGWIVLPDGRQRGEVVSGATDVASPALDPNNPTVQIKRGKKKPLIVIIAILIG